MDVLQTVAKVMDPIKVGPGVSALSKRTTVLCTVVLSAMSLLRPATSTLTLASLADALGHRPL
jgi:hypothetical protein